MAGPDFDPNKRKLLFFCRGRGRGHAIPDIEITEELLRLRTDVDVRFVSYGTGAQTLAERGFSVIDLGLPEINSLLDVIVLSTKIIAWLEPDIVVAHEEFGALPAAKVFDRPTVFITDWFVAEDRIIMATLRFADQILFIDHESSFPEPSYVKDKVTYVGPVLRRFEYALSDRARARRELGLDEEGVVVAVLPGSYATETRAPIADLVLDAFDRLEGSPKKLLWIAGKDATALEDRTHDREDVQIIETDWQIDRIMVASDVAITKANRKTVVELESLGVPSVALSPELNPVDDARVRASEGVTFRRLAETQPEVLASDLEAAIQGGPLKPAATEGCRPVEKIAEHIADALDQACAEQKAPQS